MLGIGPSVAFQKELSASHAVSRGQLSQKTIFPQIWRRPTNVDGFVPTLSAFFGAFWQRPFWFFSWIMWHFSWIMWLYSIWPCSFLLLFLDDVALFLDHLALLNLALQFYSFLTPYTCSLMLARRPFCECKPQCIPACPQCIQTSIYIHIYICLASFTRYYCLALSNMSFPCNAMRCCFTGLAEALANKN